MAFPKTLREQERALRRRWNVVSSRIEWSKEGDILIAKLRLKPSETTAEYVVGILYTPGVRPHVYVADPKPVKQAHGRPTPHLNADGTLCLYDPAAAEWDESQELALTIIPWTMRWLVHYEHWIVFGDWRGDAPSQPEKGSAGESSSSSFGGQCSSDFES